MITLEIPRGKVHEWLWYETGMDQMHAMPEIIDWMATHGWLYNTAWGVRRESLTIHDLPVRHHHLWFTQPEQMTAFRLRWA